MHAPNPDAYIAARNQSRASSELRSLPAYSVSPVLGNTHSPTTCIPSLPRGPRTELVVPSSRKLEMSTESSRVRAPTPTALVLALLLLMGSSSWSRIVAHGVRMTTPRAGASGPAADGGVLGLGEAAPDAASSSRISSTDKQGRAAASPEEESEELWAKERAATGSRLPDCAHACGPCSPCRRVMVSFMCAQASESCPVAYRCMCRGRFFRVPAL